MSLSTHAVFYLLNKTVDLLCTRSRDDRSSCFVISAKEVMFSSLSVCLSVCLCAKTSERICMKFSGKVGNGPVNKCLNFGGDRDRRMYAVIVFRIRHYWEIRKVVSTDCTPRRCSAGHAVAGIVIATMTSLHHRPTTDSHVTSAMPWRRYALSQCF